ncbi:hypothetical protein K431DRAFT_304442 [Polychaeton citri CBS 116435]|uniref:Uncharacterized protein n=1 Tax=Polychaeton citri CBS 116435 TaxID=1314669 RepID=A0A9P4UPQ3_9PEZI|nr:hypothetical protein K431DRAFT_304442 [Polychaeton citri CBS 116435]
MPKTENSHVWTQEERRFLHVLHNWFKQTSDLSRQQCACLFNQHFKMDLSQGTIESQYRQRTRTNAPAHWIPIERTPLRQREINAVVQAADSLRIDLGPTVPMAAAVASESSSAGLATVQSDNKNCQQRAPIQCSDQATNIRPAQPSLSTGSRTDHAQRQQADRSSTVQGHIQPTFSSAEEPTQRRVPMIHSSEVQWVLEQPFWPVYHREEFNWITDAVDAESTIYRWGGQLRRVIVGWHVSRRAIYQDLMLCDRDKCRTCSPYQALETLDLAQSPMVGLPFVHLNEARADRNGRQHFYPLPPDDRRRDGNIRRGSQSGELVLYDGHPHVVRFCSLDNCRGILGSGFCIQAGLEDDEDEVATRLQVQLGRDVLPDVTRPPVAEGH